MDYSKLKIIKISVEYHNQDDEYYTDFNDYYFYTFNKTEGYINSILKGLSVTQYKDDDYFSLYKNIDIKDLIEQLESYDIYQIEADVSCSYEINEESEHASYIKD
jgi:hypothetical protein